ncbi:hypothetical protein B0J13DRAFT_78494 [Dactylonectria estremocensis]|uniref:Uncharacterized protein n=1 Tax=Dactylonectria estremocensis TaxID=1079267 RepID=A0A9P9EFU1_9HYPO|nr:hypothetical protein B0J13DRAFT_78494 [Dactylonectria estremocensis]
MATVAATQASRPGSASSVDQLFELVDGLDDAQIHSLLQDFNNTVASNVPVSHGVDLFEHPKPKPTPVRVLSIRRSAFNLPRLFTRPSKRQSSAPVPISRPRTALPTSARHYRRISRPVLPSPSSGPDLDALLSAYLAPIPPKSTPNLSSPSSTRSISTSSSMSVEADNINMDSWAPLVFGRRQRQSREMGDIFEVLEF